MYYKNNILKVIFIITIRIRIRCPNILLFTLLYTFSASSLFSVPSLRLFFFNLSYLYIQLYFTTYLCEFVQRLSLIANHTSKVGILSRGTRLAGDLFGFLIIRRRSISYDYMLMARSKKKKI